MDDKIATTFGDALAATGYAGAAGLTAGVGIQAVKELLRRRNVRRQPSHDRHQLASIPVEVDEEEAEKLRRRGVAVKMAVKQAAQETSTQAWLRSLANTALKNIGIGAGAVAGGYVGWQGAGHLLDRSAKRSQKARNERMRRRIKNLLDEDPEEQDVKFAAYMQAGVDNLLLKEGAVGSVAALLTMALGAGATTSMISGAHNAINSRRDPNVKAISTYLERERPAARQPLRLQPVLRRRQDEDEDEPVGGPAAAAGEGR